MSRCSSGKIGYATRDLAIDAVYRYQIKTKPGREVPIRAYYCFECGRFHITSQVKNALADKTQTRDFLWFLGQLLS